MSNQIFMQGCSMQDFYDNVRGIVAEVMQEMLQEEMANQTPQNSTEYLNANEACEYLNITKPTLYKLVREGILNKQNLAGTKSVRYKKADLDNCLE